MVIAISTAGTEKSVRIARGTNAASHAISFIPASALKRWSNHQPETICPARMASIAVICCTPDAKPRCFEPTSSLLIPIFAGLKNADCTASRKNPSSASGILWVSTATQISERMATWAMAAPRMTLRFENRSLIHPASGAKRTKGSAIISPAADSAERVMNFPRWIS